LIATGCLFDISKDDNATYRKGEENKNINKALFNKKKLPLLVPPLVPPPLLLTLIRKSKDVNAINDNMNGIISEQINIKHGLHIAIFIKKYVHSL
jgi:hypothetical protein